MFRRGRVSVSELAAIAADASSSTVTYEGVGSSLTGEFPNGYRHDRHEIRLPDRSDSFELAVLGLKQWAAHRGAGMTVAPCRAPDEGATVAVAARIGVLTAVAVCRVVAVVDEPRRHGFAYGTLPGHPERGEEAFVVEQSTGGAVFKIAAFSQPAELLARVGGPITRGIQLRATRRYLDGLHEFVSTA